MTDEEKNDEPKQEKCVIISTTNLYPSKKKKEKSGMITTHDLPDELPFYKQFKKKEEKDEQDT